MEVILTKTKNSYLKNKILFSEIEVIDRLLARTNEMKDVYEELAGKLSYEEQENLWDALLGVATFWNPDSSKNLRNSKKKLIKLNQEISQTAIKLSSLIKEREEICETSSISAYDDYHPVHWIHRAAEPNYNYEGYVKKKLQLLASQFNLKYWPRTNEVVEAIAAFADEAEISENNSWTEELICSPKQSMADYIRVILKAIEDRKDPYGSPAPLPTDFRLSDNSLATFINCSLNLPADDLLSSENVKRSRQNIRKGSREN